MTDIEDLAGTEFYDVVVIGAGCVGASIARELSKFDKLKVLVVEQETDVSQGASKANSGIVHGGYDSKGKWKSKLERRGNQMFEDICRDLSVPFKRVGSLVLSFTERDDNELERLFANGFKNGVDDLEFWDRDRVLREEPHVSVGVRQALYCPSAGITNPYLYTIANCENAIQNGVDFRLGTKVIMIHKGKETFDLLVESIESKKRQRLRSRKVVNCAGVMSDMFTAPGELEIKPRRGEYFILSKEQGHMVNRVIFQAPTERWGKGVLVSPTVDGNLLLGPSASDIPEKTNKSTTFQELAYVAWAARRSVPHIDTRLAIRSFAGIRAKSSSGDFVIFEKDGLVHAAGIDSPGLTSSPAIAKEVVAMLKLPNDLKTDWNDKRTPYNFRTAARAGEELRFEHPDSELNIVCRCEHVTESTIRESMKRGLPIRSTDSVKWRTRAGMGQCGGVRCRPIVCGIIASENGIEDATKIPKAVIGQAIPQRLVKAELGKL